MRGVHDRVDAYDYAHPPEAVAQEPAARREDARLLVVPRHGWETGGETGGATRDDSAAWLQHGRVSDLARWLAPGDLLVVNDTRVEPARLEASRATGGRIDVLVLDAHGARARVLLGARGKLVVGEELSVGDDLWRLVAAHGGGEFEVEGSGDIAAALERAGRMPLPPYIRREKTTDPRDALDRERYQTTFARGAEDGSFGAVAAPTAGLHLTPALLEALPDVGVEVARLTLHVGTGTFRPLRGETLDDHEMHAERFVVPEALAERYAVTRVAGGRIVAVGTTVVRALESAVQDGGLRLRPGPSETRLFLRPGHRFTAVDAMLTNFHQPRSTLLVLVAAFAGLRTMRAAYAHAISAGYRLFSYGDATLLI